MTQPTVVVRMVNGFAEDFFLHGDARLLIIDESSPLDRVYQYTTQCSQAEIDALIGDDEIGSKQDARHPGITARILSYLSGKPRLSLVKDNDLCGPRVVEIPPPPAPPKKR